MGEAPKKYHVTDEGDVYRINEDGSFTSIGNAEKMSKQPNGVSPKNDSVGNPENYGRNKKWSRKAIIVIAILAIIVVAAGIFLIVNRTDGKAESSRDISTLPDEPYNAEKILNTSDVENVASELNIEDPEGFCEQIVPEEKPLTLPEPHISSKKSDKSAETSPSKQNDTTTDSSDETSMEDILKWIEEVERAEREMNTIEEEVPYEEPYSVISVVDPDKIYTAVEIPAEFPGGHRGYNDWFNNNLVWPRDEAGRALYGDVRIGFVVERDGSVTNVKVTESTDSRLNATAIQLFNNMPRWSPALVKNQPVRSSLTIDVYF